MSAIAGVDESLALRRTDDGTVLYLAEPVCLDRPNAFGAPSGDLPEDVLACLRERAPGAG